MIGLLLIVLVLWLVLGGRPADASVWRFVQIVALVLIILWLVDWFGVYPLPYNHFAHGRLC
jgi:hypothetical protein